MNAQLHTPKEAVSAVLFLRDEVRKGKLAMAPLLKKKLLEIGLFSERAFQRLVDEGRKAFLARTRESDRIFKNEVENLTGYETTNVDFRRKVKEYVDRVFGSKSEVEIYARIDVLKGFLEEFGFMNDEFLRGQIGKGLYEKYLHHEKAELMDETEQEAQ